MQERTIGDILTLPNLPFEARCNLPKDNVIYFVVSQNNEVLYIGETMNLRERWRSHHHAPTLKSLSGVRIFWADWNGCSEMGINEADLIRQFAPPLNTPRQKTGVHPITFRLPISILQEIRATSRRRKKEKIFPATLDDIFTEVINKEISRLTIP